jgi:hypothetical protein
VQCQATRRCHIQYPWLIEGAWPLSVQYGIWLAGCALLAALSLLCAIVSARSAASAPTPVQRVPASDAGCRGGGRSRRSLQQLYDARCENRFGSRAGGRGGVGGSAVAVTRDR